MAIAVLLAASPTVGATLVTGPQASGLGVSLTASPVVGPAPLLVGFWAGLNPKTVYATFNWSFGDSHWLQESATGTSAPAHSYASPGNYTITLRVTSSYGDANATLRVTALKEALTARITATPLTGSAPLTVHFATQLSGGTGTYRSVLWDFGDGDRGSGLDLMYTYSLPGHFNASVTAVDSANSSASAWAAVVVAISVSPSHPSGPSVATQNLYWVGGATVLAAAVGVLFLYRTALVRRAARDSSTGAATAAASPGPVPTPPGPTSGEVEPPATSPPVDESLRLSERILVHLYWFGRPSSDGTVRFEASQQGMATQLGVGQNSISKAIRRLVDAGAVRVELQHVPGPARRVKTYTLTPRGEAVARSLDRHRGGR